MTDDSDQELLAAARAGDGRALEELLQRHQAQVYRFGMKLCRDPEDAKDVLQDTLLAAARGVRDFRGASSISTWLFTIARSFCIKQRRKGKVVGGEDGNAGGVTSDAESPDQALASREVETALQTAIGALEPASREVLLLRDVEGLTAKEVAEVTGSSVQAVKSRLHRARLSVRERVAPLLGIEPKAQPPAGADCPDVLNLLSRHLEGEISPEVCARMERHLEDCERCRGACDSLKRVLTLCKAAAAPEVPQAISDSVRSAVRGFLAGTKA